MTYSDVITLLMTFFILLLTFATSEPEKFERLQVSMFGGAGATGLAGEYHGPQDKDELLMRLRPKSSRLATQGAQAAPIHTDPALTTVADGLAGLEEDPEIVDRYSVDLPFSFVISSDGNLTAIAKQQLRMVARQLRQSEFSLTLQVRQPEDIPSLLAMTMHLTQTEGVVPGRIAVGASHAAKPGHVRLLLSRLGKRSHG
jgi:flagellar motor protein MotB